MKAGLSILALAILAFSSWAGAAEKGEALTNADVVGMVQAGIDISLVKQKIQKSANRYDVSAEAMVALRKDSVPDEIISLMLEAAEKSRNQIMGHISLQIQALASDIPETRQNAFLDLMKAGKQAHPKMIDALANLDPKVRAADIAALCKMEVRDAIGHIKVMLDDSESIVRIAAADALASMVPEESRKLADEKVRAWSYQSPDRSADAHARMAGRLGMRDLLPNLRIFLQESEDDSLREQAAWALDQLADEGAREILERSLTQDRSAPVRAAAALALGKLAKRESVSAFAKVIDTDRENRELYFRVLSNFPKDDAVPVLILRVGDQLSDAEKKALSNSLRRLTRQDFGDDMSLWLDWWEKAEGKPIGKDPSASAPAAPRKAAATPAPPVPVAAPAGSAPVNRKDAAPVKPQPEPSVKPAESMPKPASPATAAPAASGKPPLSSAKAETLPKEAENPPPKRDEMTEQEMDRLEEEAMRKAAVDVSASSKKMPKDVTPPAESGSEYEGGASLVPKGLIEPPAKKPVKDKARTSAVSPNTVEEEETSAEVIKK